jgi:hypothetical protein
MRMDIRTCSRRKWQLYYQNWNLYLQHLGVRCENSVTRCLVVANLTDAFVCYFARFAVRECTLNMVASVVRRIHIQ